MIAPAFVVVDTIDGMVFTNDGNARFDDFGEERAFKFAATRNKELKHPTYKVYRLVPVENNGQ
jgi:hypothetical protein